MLTSTFRQIIHSSPFRQSLSALNPLYSFSFQPATRSYGCMVHADTVPIVLTDGNAADLLSTATPAVSILDYRTPETVNSIKSSKKKFQKVDECQKIC